VSQQTSKKNFAKTTTTTTTTATHLTNLDIPAESILQEDNLTVAGIHLALVDSLVVEESQGILADTAIIRTRLKQ